MVRHVDTRFSWRFQAEVAVALIAAVLGIITCMWPDWLEQLTGWDPDAHSGLAEWTIVAVLFMVSAMMSTVALREWSRAAATLS